MTEFQELREELAQIRREFTKRAITDIQERLNDKAVLLLKIEEMEERFREREKTLLARIKVLSDIQKVQAHVVFGKPEGKV